MKYFATYISILLYIYSFGQWTDISIPDGSRNYSVFFTSADTGFYISGHSIWRTRDGGSSWTLSDSTHSNRLLRSIYFVDRNIGYAVGNTVVSGFVRACILKTIDGGNSWVTNYTSHLYNAIAVQFLNPNVGYVTTESEYYLKTQNGGNSWDSIHITNQAQTCLHFLNVDTGYIVRLNDTIYKTTNGGLNWSALVYPSGWSALGVAFTSIDTGFLVAAGHIYKTTDGGNTWSNQISNVGGLYAIKFINSLTGYVVGENGLILKTIDGGITWNTSSSNGSYGYILGISFPENCIGYVVGDSGLVLKTMHGGIPSPSVINNLDTLSAPENFSYQWFRNDTLLLGATLQKHKPLIDGCYSVEVFDNDGCSSISDTICIQISTTGIEKSETENSILIYPNPATENLTISINGKADFVLTDVVGKQVKRGMVINQNKISVSDLIDGVYFITVRLVNGIMKTTRLIMK